VPTGPSETNVPEGDVRQSTATPARASALRWALAALLVLAIAAFYTLGLQEYFSLEYGRSHLDLWRGWVADHRFAVLLVFFLVYTTVTALSLPAAALLTLVGGALFGRWLGTAVVSAASTLGATLAFLSSRYVLGAWVQRRFGARLQGVNEGLTKDGAYYLLTLRLVPLFPFFLINLGMGLTRIRTGTYVWVSWLGMLPGTFLYVNAGTALSEIHSLSGLVSPTVLGSLALLGIFPLMIRTLLRWKKRDPSIGTMEPPAETEPGRKP
jgi:uncharacterized membrane protein YdjX (TVP38/TMEM64 family)